MSIGIAVITYNRPVQAISTVTSIVDHCPTSDYELVVVNDGQRYPHGTFANDIDTISLGRQRGVSVAKNTGLQHLLDCGCEHIFIFEDDQIVLTSDIWDGYIDAATVTGIHHFNFQRGNGGTSEVRYQHKYTDDIAVDFFKDPLAQMSYFNGALFNLIDPYDPKFVNAFEHIDIEKRLDDLGLAPPFWYFPDIAQSAQLLMEADNNQSVITGRGNYQKNWDNSAQHFVDKHGIFTSQIPDSSLQQVVARLDHLKNNYAQT